MLKINYEQNLNDFHLKVAHYQTTFYPKVFLLLLTYFFFFNSL